MQSDYRSLTNDQLTIKLRALLTDTSRNLYDICCILMEQYNRGELDPSMRQGVFKWFPQIARGELDPLAAYTLDGMDARVRSMVGLPLEEQRRLANGGTVTVASLTREGKVIAEDKALYQISARDFETVFDSGKVRPFLAQKAIITKRPKPTPGVAHRSNVPIDIRVDARTEEIIIGQLRVPALDIATALRKLGFRVERTTALAA